MCTCPYRTHLATKQSTRILLHPVICATMKNGINVGVATVSQFPRIILGMNISLGIGTHVAVVNGWRRRGLIDTQILTHLITQSYRTFGHVRRQDDDDDDDKEMDLVLITLMWMSTGCYLLSLSISMSTKNLTQIKETYWIRAICLWLLRIPSYECWINSSFYDDLHTLHVLGWVKFIDRFDSSS